MEAKLSVKVTVFIVYVWTAGLNAYLRLRPQTYTCERGLSERSMYRNSSNTAVGVSAYEKQFHGDFSFCVLTVPLPKTMMRHVVKFFSVCGRNRSCDHSNKTSSAVLLQGTICFTIFKKR